MSVGVGRPGVTIGDAPVDLGSEEMLGVLRRLLRGVLGLVWRRGMGGGRLLAGLCRMGWRKPRVPSEVGLAEVEAVGVGAGRPQGGHGGVFADPSVVMIQSWVPYIACRGVIGVAGRPSS